MSDFDGDYDFKTGMSGGGGGNGNATKERNTTDDFERLDEFHTSSSSTANSGGGGGGGSTNSHAIQEQREAEDLENLATAAAYSSMLRDVDSDFPRMAGGFQSGGSSSTDRPLVTPPATGHDEIHLTPDPEEKIHEPFVNVTAGGLQEDEDEELRDSPDKFPSWEHRIVEPEPEHNQPPAYQFEIPSNVDLDPMESYHHHQEEHDLYPLETGPAPSAPEPSLFDPIPSQHHHLMEADELEDDFRGPVHRTPSPSPSPTPSPTPAPVHPAAADLLNFGDLSSGGGGHVAAAETVQRSTADDAHEFYESEDLPVAKDAEETGSSRHSTPEIVPERSAGLETISQHAPFIAVCPAKMAEDSSAAGQGECTFHPRAWFNPSKLDPRVADLMYWRDLKRSGIAFGTGLVVLLSLTYFSLISVVAYVLLAVLTGTLSYRIYKNVLQAVQKSGDGHPFNCCCVLEYLEVDLTLPSDKVRDGAEIFVKHLECTASRLRRLFLVEDLVDSLKFALVLWVFTYIGSWFNGLTLFILGFIALFTLPKVYETYKVQIDHYIGIVCGQIGDVYGKIRAKVPIGQKPKQP